MARFLPPGGMTQEFADQLATVGRWSTNVDGTLRCPDCVDGKIARYVWSDSGDKQYKLTPSDDGKWTCGCRGHKTWGHCKHADRLNAETARAGSFSAPGPVFPQSTQPANDDGIPDMVPAPAWMGMGKIVFPTRQRLMPKMDERKRMTAGAIRLAKTEAWRALTEADKAQNYAAWMAAHKRLSEACDAVEVAS
jgi:hypothetical protein